MHLQLGQKMSKTAILGVIMMSHVEIGSFLKIRIFLKILPDRFASRNGVKLASKSIPIGLKPSKHAILGDFPHSAIQNVCKMVFFHKCRYPDPFLPLPDLKLIFF